MKWTGPQAKYRATLR